MHYYKRNIGDYAKKAGRLSMLEHGAYTLLIDACYDRERFPTIDEALDWCWARSEEEEQAVKFVLSRFFDLKDGVYIQSRIAEEIAAYVKNAEINKRIATEREQKRKGGARTVHEPSPCVNEPPPNHKPLTNNQEPITNKQDKEKPQAAERASRSSVSKPDDVDIQVWSDWVAHRKAKKAPVTQTALDGIAREATKANITMQTALQTMCERGWTGFKAEWLQNVAGKAAAASVRRSENFDGFLGEPDDRNVIDSTAKWVQ